MTGKKRETDESIEVVEELPESLEETTKENLEPEANVKDITEAARGIWPGNTPHRVGSYYFDLHKLGLKAGETGLFCALPEGFVYERLDVHGIESPNAPLKIELKLDNKESMGLFHQKQGELAVNQVSESDVHPGTYSGKKKIFIRSENDMPDKGRILVSFVGYQIESWR